MDPHPSRQRDSLRGWRLRYVSGEAEGSGGGAPTEGAAVIWLEVFQLPGTPCLRSALISSFSFSMIICTPKPPESIFKLLTPFVFAEVRGE